MIIVPTTIGHLVTFLNIGRELDIKEMEIGGGKSLVDFPLADLSQCLTLLDEEGNVYAIGGIFDHTVWMLCTKIVETNKIKFLRETKRILKDVLKHTDYLENFVWTKNKMHMDWLRWMGAEFGQVYGDFQYFRFNGKERDS